MIDRAEVQANFDLAGGNARPMVTVARPEDEGVSLAVSVHRPT
jgi:hypothetical protein